MKAYSVTNLNLLQCPKCSGTLKEMKILTDCVVPLDESGKSIRATGNSVDIHSVDKNCRNHISGMIVFCPTCEELMFLYGEYDTRECKDCKHCRYIVSSGNEFSHQGSHHCDWYNNDIPDGYSGTGRSCCNHIDEELKELPEYAMCALCEHCSISEQMKDYYCILGIKYYQKIYDEADLYKREKACCAFKLNYSRYRDYRKHWDKLGNLFDESVHIPEYDQMIAEEGKQTHVEVHLLYDGYTKIPVSMMICTYAMNHDKYLISLSYEGDCFYSNTDLQREGLPIEDAIKKVRESLLQQNNFSKAVAVILGNYVRGHLNKDMYDIVKKYH